jgi:hypothetical protein
MGRDCDYRQWAGVLIYSSEERVLGGQGSLAKAA